MANPTGIFAQIAPDCADATELSVRKVYVSPAVPQGGGEVVEFPGNRAKSLYHFREEHNTAWYKFRIPNDGLLALDIIPEQVRDDYDFILYRIEQGDPCEKIRSGSLLPVRSCISRTDPQLAGRTGLSDDAGADFIHSGPGASYSRSLEVKEGEWYLLVLDNVYPEGGRHQIRFRLAQPALLTGRVQPDSAGKIPAAVVALTDPASGEVIFQTPADLQTGEYTLPLNLDPQRAYEVAITAPHHFFKKYPVDQEALREKGNMRIETSLDVLEVGRNYILDDLKFNPNKSVLRAGSISSVRQLLILMQDHPGLHIEIEGHTNCAGNNYGPNDKDQPLSEARAKKIFSLLTAKGIDPDRMTTIGYGCSRMLIPNARELSQQMINMRVEIKITAM
ncbi:MAG: OmpA family protein [Bacteroidia bacterium]|nr:OmpA family protein [Bacteroidia bacterium]